MEYPQRRGSAWIALAAGVLIAFILMALLCHLTGHGLTDYPYNSYLLQAQAWLRGKTCLDYDRPFLELAIKDGAYYVSFPPVPSVPMVLLALVFGDDVPGGLFLKLYAAAVCAVVLAALLRTRRISPVSCVVWALLFTFGGALLPLTSVGAVWYEAQILALLFSVSAVSLVLNGRPTAACLCYALSVGCRPFSALLSPALLLCHLGEEEDGVSDAKKLRALIPGIVVGLCVAAAYGWYNCIRFGSPFEFGHNYLPEFTRSTYGQLSLHYLPENLKQILAGSPFSTIANGKIELNCFGFSMFASCPLLVCGLVWFVRDLIRRRMTPLKWVCLISAAVNVLLLCLHRTLGGHQFGLRYALELFPYVLIPLLTDRDRHGIEGWELTLLTLGFAFNFIGGIAVHV